MKKIYTVLLLLAMTHVAYAESNCNTQSILANHTQGQFTAIGDGAEIHDKATNLIWQRCSLGQTWNGTTCTGEPSSHNWQEADALSQQLGNGYRLPTIAELSSLVNYQCHEPAMDLTVFPATVTDGDYWSASPYLGSHGHAWGISSYIGDTNYFVTDSERHVRAVRHAE